MTKPEPVLSVENFSLSFGASSTNLIDDISFSVEPGKTLCLVGAVSYTHLTLPTTERV